MLFSLLACHQCLVWNTFGPIESETSFAYPSWQGWTVPMFANWGTIMFVLTAIPLTKLVEKNLRSCVLLVSFLTASGTLIRCCRIFSKNSTVFLVSCHLCSILNGISGVTICAAPSLLSSQWFPPSERTTATSINQAFNMLGNGLAMVVGPALVHTGKNLTDNNLFHPFGNTSEEVKQAREEIDTYMQIDAGVAVGLFILFCIYFPSAPPHPPAPSSAIQRTQFREGIMNLLTNRDAILVCFSYSISQGVMGAWLSVMVNNFSPLGISDKTIGYIGLTSVLSQCLLSLAFGYLTDRLKHYMKITIILLLTIATAGFVWLMFICLKIGPHTLPVIYAAVIIATSLNFSCIPLFFELCVEIAYPVNEGLVGAFLTIFYNLIGIIFLFIFFFPGLGYVWINYALVGSTLLAIPAMALVRETYNRSNVDDIISSTRAMDN